MSQKRPPGPVGTSCLTCKRRRKQCDRGRPACTRCMKAGFECLGYDHLVAKRRGALSSSHAKETTPPIRSLPPSALGLSVESSDMSFGDGNDPISLGSTFDSSFAYPQDDVPIGHGTGLTLGGRDPHVSKNALVPLTSSSNYHSLNSVNGSGWSILADPCSPVSPSASDGNPSQYSPHNHTQLAPRLEPRAARALSPLSPDVNYIISLSIVQHARILGIVYFRSGDSQVASMQNTFVNRLQSSSIARCVAYICCRTIKWLMDETSQDNRSTLMKLLDQFEQKLQQVSTQPTTNVDEAAGRRNGFLEASMLRIRLLGTGTSAYRLLHAMAPTFLQIVRTNPTVWPNFNGPPRTSLARIFSSVNYELAHFAHIDLACAMAYGLPQVVQYDTSTPDFHSDSRPIEWAYCCPPEFQICLADINIRCANGYISHDWHLIERRLRSYEPDLSGMNNLGSWRVVARLAMIESWRQTLLIYLYMAVCGSVSDDTRVQAAVQQILLLSETLKQPSPPRADIHPVLHYLVAGICARGEKQRTYLRERLQDARDHGLWLLPGSEFLPVLDHLWHGAAADGRPIRWSDYILSRHEALPISLA